MNDPFSSAEAARWSRLGRRWSITLGILLTLNLSLVVVAGWGYGDGTTLSRAESHAAQEEPVIEIPGAPASVAVETLATAATVDSPPAPASQPVSSAEEPETTPVAEPGSDPIVKAPEPPIEPLAPEAPSETRPAPAPAVVHEAVVIVNPPSTGGVIHFLVDDELESLEAGQFRQLDGDEPRQIIFHKGDEFENVTLKLQPGVFVFSVTTAGWQLDEAGEEAIAALCEVCQAADEH